MKKAAPRSEGATRPAKPRPQASDPGPRPRRVVYPSEALSFEAEVLYLRGQADILNARADEIEAALARSKSAQQPKANTRT